MLCRNFEVARVPDSPPPEEVYAFTMMRKNAWVTLRRRTHRAWQESCFP